MKFKIIIILAFGFVMSCTDHFEDLNTDTKHPASVKAESLFTSAQERFYNILNSSNVNNNVTRLYAQYWSQTTYPDESQYNMVSRNNSFNWSTRLYRDVLKDLDEAKKLLSSFSPVGPDAIAHKNKLAIIEFNEIHAYMTLVDLMGDTPYSEALDFANPAPKYDDAATIYADLATRLDKVISDLSGDVSFSSTEDLVNQGDVAKWKAAANSLKLRMAMRLADVDPAKSKAMAESAAAGVMTSNDDNLSIEYITTPPYTNPVYEDLVLSGRTDFVASNTFVDRLNELNDPRKSAYFDSNLKDTLGNVVYKGGDYGNANAFDQSTHLGDALYTAGQSRRTVLSYSKVRFLLAEAAARG